MGSSVLDGALEATLRRAGFESVVEAVAQHTVFLHPETVLQTQGKALFRVVRDAPRRDQVGELPDGTRVMFDDNTVPTLAFLWSAGLVRPRDVQFNHVWADSRSPDSYTALWNVCATPSFLAKPTDTDPVVAAALRFRAWDLFGFGLGEPVRPAGYDRLCWPEHPAPVPDLEGVLRRRMTEAPRSRPSRSARELGWLYGD
jgi:hypothetical protein